MTERPTTLRFAVATFDTGDGLRSALHNLRRDGLRDDAFNCLGLEEVITGMASLAHLPAVACQRLSFPENLRPIGCTAGVLAECLAARLRAGTPTLKAALGHWLIPRHAAQLQDAVERGKIVLWVRLFDGEDELLVCRSLLAGSSLSVGVHDLVAE